MNSWSLLSWPYSFEACSSQVSLANCYSEANWERELAVWQSASITFWHNPLHQWHLHMSWSNNVLQSTLCRQLQPLRRSEQYFVELKLLQAGASTMIVLKAKKEDLIMQLPSKQVSKPCRQQHCATEKCVAKTCCHGASDALVFNCLQWSSIQAHKHGAKC